MICLLCASTQAEGRGTPYVDHVQLAAFVGGRKVTVHVLACSSSEAVSCVSILQKPETIIHAWANIMTLGSYIKACASGVDDSRHNVTL